MKNIKKRKWLLLIIASLFITTFIFIWIQFPIFKTLLPGYHSVIYTPTKYHQLLQQNKKELLRLKSSELDSISKIPQTEKLFVKHITSAFPYWYGTTWSFNGTSETPGNGSIACGYFVTTILQQSGLNINRNKLAQMGSEQMIKSICDDEIVTRFGNYEMNDFIKYIQSSGNGIYLLGLDTHTGFIWNDDGNIYFVHASGRFPFCVKKEKAIESITLWKSKYKVIAKISGDTSVLMKWQKHRAF
jgi:hypothetical protein